MGGGGKLLGLVGKGEGEMSEGCWDQGEGWASKTTHLLDPVLSPTVTE